MRVGAPVPADRRHPLKPRQALRAARPDAQGVRRGELEGRVRRRKTDMATTKQSRTQSDSYFALVRRFPLTVLRDDDHLASAVALADELTDLDRRDAGQEDYLNALSVFIERYEDKHAAVPHVT